MLITKDIINEAEVCYFDSENIFKAEYFPSKNQMFVYFIRKRKSKEPLKESQDKKKILLQDKKTFLEGSIYNILNIDRDTWEKFIGAESQGNFYNMNIVKNPKYFKNGNIEMFASEMKELIETAGKKDKGFLF